jgi:hypothetical protein
MPFVKLFLDWYKPQSLIGLHFDLFVSQDLSYGLAGRNAPHRINRRSYCSSENMYSASGSGGRNELQLKVGYRQVESQACYGIKLIQCVKQD